MHSVPKIWIVQPRTYGYDRSIETRIRCQFFEPYFAPKLWHLDACFNTEVPHPATDLRCGRRGRAVRGLMGSMVWSGREFFGEKLTTKYLGECTYLLFLKHN